MTITKITRLVPTGIRHTSWAKTHFKVVEWFRRVVVEKSINDHLIGRGHAFDTGEVDCRGNSIIWVHPWYRKSVPTPVIIRSSTASIAYGDVFVRFWIGDKNVFTYGKAWTGCSDDHIREKLAEEGFGLRWFDSLVYSNPSNGIWDIYINSSIMEKLYASVGEARL